MPELKHFVLWGSSGHAKVLAETISMIGGEVVALFDNNHNALSVISAVPIFYGEEGFFDWINNIELQKHQVSGLVAIGGSSGQERLKIQSLFRTNGFYVPILRHPSATVSKSAFLGDGTQVLAQSNIAADVVCGAACIINHRASVDHESSLGNSVHLGPGATLCGCVSVGDHVFIGAGAIVLPRVSIGKDSVIGAGAVVTKNVPPNVVVLGNPAKTHQKN